MTSKVDSEPVPTGIIVVELDDVVPRRHPDLPNLFVASTDLPLEERFESLPRSRRHAWIRDHIVALRSDLSVEPTDMSREAAQLLGKRVSKDLRRQGFTVNRYTRVWTVYVVELEPAAKTNPGRGVLYVGETSRTPEERFAQHMKQERTAKGGRLHSPVVSKYGRRLRMDLAPKELAFDKESAKRAEAAWGEHLRSLGYVVKGAH
ncbi:MAG: hypothetical protein RLZ37_1132 [Actinomycetota bacterium]